MKAALVSVRRGHMTWSFLIEHVMMVFVEGAEFRDVDVLLCLLVAQIARYQGQTGGAEADWVSMSAVEALCQRLGHLGAAAIERGWHESASRRGLLDVRESGGGPQVRLAPTVASSVGIDVN